MIEARHHKNTCMYNLIHHEDICMYHHQHNAEDDDQDQLKAHDDDDDVHDDINIMMRCLSRFCLFHFLPFLGTFGFRNKKKSV